MNATVVYLTNDLMFSSRVRSQAQSAGVALAVVGSRAALREQVDAGGVTLVLVDLDHRDADMRALMSELSSGAGRPRVVAYASHVKESLLEAAQAAGCDLVMSRGQFDRQIGTLLAAQQPPGGPSQPAEGA